MKNNFFTISLSLFIFNAVLASEPNSNQDPAPKYLPKLYQATFQIGGFSKKSIWSFFVPFSRQTNTQNTSNKEWKELREQYPFTFAVALNRFWHTFDGFAFYNPVHISSLNNIHFDAHWKSGNRVFTSTFALPMNPHDLAPAEASFVDTFNKAPKSFSLLSLLPGIDTRNMDSYTHCRKISNKITCTSIISDEMHSVVFAKYKNDKVELAKNQAKHPTDNWSIPSNY